MTGDVFNGKEWKRYAQHAVRELIPKVRDASVVISLMPTGESDIKFALELGVALMMDKPIILLVQPGTQIPAKLAQIADAHIEFDADDQAGTQARVHAAINDIFGEGTV